MMEMVVPDYDRLGVVPSRQGSRLPGTAPNNLYRASDDRYVLIAANNNAVFERMARAMQRDDLWKDPRFNTIRGRNTNHMILDDEVAAWAATLPAAEIVERMEAEGVPVSLVNTIADIFVDPHFRHREMLLELPHPVLGTVMLNGVVPKLSRTPGEVRHAGRRIGEDTHAVLSRLLGLSDVQLAHLTETGVIHQNAGAANE